MISDIYFLLLFFYLVESEYNPWIYKLELQKGCAALDLMRGAQFIPNRNQEIKKTLLIINRYSSYHFGLFR